jgi:N-acetylmuramoyl-L-alanine amidase
MRRMRRIVLSLVLLLAGCSSGGTSPVLPTSSTTTTAPPVAKAIVTPSGVVAPVQEVLADGWRVTTPCSASAVVTEGTPLHEADVVLDPGHGGKETGSVGANGLVERDLNLAVANKAKDALEDRGYTVVLTRTRDIEMTLQARAGVARTLGAKAFVSIHHNGGPDGPSSKPGTETYYQHQSPDSKRLGDLLYEEIVAAFAGRPGVAWFGNRDAGAKYRVSSNGVDDYYGILRNAKGVPAVLSEALFLSASPTEAALLARADVQTAEAEAIASAIDRFLTTDDPGSGFVTPLPRYGPAGPGGAAAGCVETPLV